MLEFFLANRDVNNYFCFNRKIYTKSTITQLVFCMGVAVAVGEFLEMYLCPIEKKRGRSSVDVNEKLDGILKLNVHRYRLCTYRQLNPC